MPHYKDGTEARVGDQVFGKFDNTPGVRAGTIISITPGAESCNAMVGFLVTDSDSFGGGVRTGEGTPTRMAIHENPDSRGNPRSTRYRVTRPAYHCSVGEAYKLVECADFCAVSELTKVGP